MNRLLTDIEEEVAEPEVAVAEKPSKKIAQEKAGVNVAHDNVFTAFLKKGFISSEDATRALPFILYLSLLGMIYIANRHITEKNIRDIDKISKEVKELSWDYKSTKADLAFKSTLTEVAKRADTLGVKVSVDPPQKLLVKEEGDK